MASIPNTSNSPPVIPEKHRVHQFFRPIEMNEQDNAIDDDEPNDKTSLASKHISSVPLIPSPLENCQHQPLSTGSTQKPHYQTRSYTKQQALLQGPLPGILKHTSPLSPTAPRSSASQDILKEFDALYQSPKDDNIKKNKKTIKDKTPSTKVNNRSSSEDTEMSLGNDTDVTADVDIQMNADIVAPPEEINDMTLEDKEMSPEDDMDDTTDVTQMETPDTDEDVHSQPPPLNDEYAQDDQEQDYIPDDPTNLHIPRYNTRSRGVRLPTTKRQRLIKAELRRTLPHMEKQVIRETNLTAPQIKQHQANDEFCKSLLQYFENGMLPNDPTAANTLLNIAPHYVNWNNTLYAIHYYPKASDRCSKLKLVVPKSLVHAILESLHTSNVGAHQGTTKTLLLAKEQFYWPRMAEDIAKFIGSCDKCLLYKRNQKVENPLMTLFQPTDAPFERLTLDFLGPLPMTPNKMRYIAIIVDHFSRYTIAFALPNKQLRVLQLSFIKMLFPYMAFRCIYTVTEDLSSTERSWLTLSGTLGSSKHGRAGTRPIQTA